LNYKVYINYIMKKIFLIILVTALVAIGATWFFLSQPVDEPIVTSEAINEQVVTASPERDEDYFDEEELVEFTKDYISVLQRLYYINQDDSADADSVSGLIISMLIEAMKDRDNLEKLLLTTSDMKENKIMGAGVTGLVLDLSVRQLIDAHSDYIDFLRGVDEYTADIAEFQYQIAQFQSSTKTVYLSMAENTGLLPVTFFKLNDDPNVSGEWRVSKESRQEILDEIELRYADIFIETEKQYLETRTRDTTVFIVQQLQEVFENVE